MPYQFATERPDHSDLASGRVFYSLPGHPAFPVRLADEVLQRCLTIREANHQTNPCTLFDPCCGAAYHLGALGYLHWEAFQEIIGSDIDPDSIKTAQKNLDLLSVTGMDQRIREIEAMLLQYRKESHRDALDSAIRLREKISASANVHPLGVRTFQANALVTTQLQDKLRGTRIDIVFADVPYGQHSQWTIPDSNNSTSRPLWHMLDALLEVLSRDSIVAIASDKSQKAQHEKYQRLEQFQVGKRRIAILKPTL
jgi:23S rRNA (guanine2535-N1)-methyltransferase